MAYQSEPDALENLQRGLRAVDPRGPEISLVETVLLACDFSEDATEIDDLVSGAIRSQAARILPRQRDPMLVRNQNRGPLPRKLL